MARLDINDMRERARLKGGKCLSKEYFNESTPLKWMCEKGHTWDIGYYIIKQGGWCVQCAKDEWRNEKLDEMKQYALKLNGKLLSQKYKNNNTKYRWQCEKGHIWQSGFYNSKVRKRNWCGQCDKLERFNALKDFAERRNGKLLSTRYRTISYSYKWQCEKGHTWNQLFSNLKKTWCVQCSREKEKYIFLQRLKKLVEKKGGQVISGSYKNNVTHLTFQCHDGHRWKAVPQNILSGYWCPHCAGSIRLTIERVKKIAKERGGECLSETYINNTTHLLFKCVKGHTWKASPANIIRGTWCPECAHPGSSADENKRAMEKVKKHFFEQHKNFNPKTLGKDGGISFMNALAKARGGKCLSAKYIRSRVKLKWKCGRNHIWETAPEVIMAGNWCPQCHGSLPGTIEKMQQLAKAKGGKCLSIKYAGSAIKLKWQCDKGHQWEATPAHISKGSWCHFCGGSARITADQIRQVAASKGGKYLSNNYKNRHTMLKWQCSEGHIWQSTYSHVSRGSWCPQCGKIKYRESRRATEAMKKNFLKNNPALNIP